MTLEKDIERKLKNLVEKYGGRCLKWTCPGWKGVPDRICLFPGGHVVFIELKRPKRGKVAPLQEWWRDELRRLGFLHYYIYEEKGLESMDAFLQRWVAEGFRE